MILMICLFNMTPTKNFKTLCSLATELLELPEGSLACKSRTHIYVATRSAVSCVARMVDHTHENIIAIGINRDRTTVYHYDRSHQGNYTSWKLYRDTFNKIYNAYTDLKNSKKNFVDIYHLQNHLKEFGVKHSSINQQSIRVISGDLTVDIILSFKDFYNQLELVKLAIKDYQAIYQIR